MKTQWIFTGVIMVVVVFILSYSFTTESPAKKMGYEDSIKKIRKEKDAFFKTNDQSPIKDKSAFKGLNYFEPNINYKVKARLEILDQMETINIKMSKSEKKEYLKYAKAHFEINGEQYTLLVMKMSRNDKILFIPFVDKTAGEDTYEGGRYLDMPMTKNTSEITLDFNMAYNPYCVYNYDYTCPIPPKENFLVVAIPAGEKKP